MLDYGSSASCCSRMSGPYLGSRPDSAMNDRHTCGCQYGRHLEGTNERLTAFVNPVGDSFLGIVND